MQIRTWRLFLLLGLAGSFCAAESTIRLSSPLGRIAPLVAQAYTSRVNITLERQPNESFQTLTRRAETVARAAAQRSFDNDILVTEAAVVVTAENGGLSAPILALEVSRDNWKNYPNAQRWSTYFPTAQALLRIQNPVPTAIETQPGQSPTNPTNTSGTGVQPSTGSTGTITPGQSPINPAITPSVTPGGTPINRGTNPPAATGTGRGTTNNSTGTANQRSNPTTNRTGTNPQQQPNSATPAARRRNQGANNDQTGTLSSPNQQTNTQSNPPRSRATYGEGLIRRTRELRDDINNRPSDLPED